MHLNLAATAKTGGGLGGGLGVSSGGSLGGGLVGGLGGGLGGHSSLIGASVGTVTIAGGDVFGASTGTVLGGACLRHSLRRGSLRFWVFVCRAVVATRVIVCVISVYRLRFLLTDVDRCHVSLRSAVLKVFLSASSLALSFMFFEFFPQFSLSRRVLGDGLGSGLGASTGGGLGGGIYNHSSGGCAAGADLVGGSSGSTLGGGLGGMCLCFASETVVVCDYDIGCPNLRTILMFVSGHTFRRLMTFCLAVVSYSRENLVGY